MTRTSAELDLRDRDAVEAFFAAERPATVVMAAAKVGGILANSTYPADFISDNLRIQVNVLDAAARHGADRAAVPRLELHLSQVRSRSRSARTACSPARSSRPTTPTRSRRSPACSRCRPFGGSTACTTSRPCRPTSTAPATTSIPQTPTCCPA